MRGKVIWQPFYFILLRITPAHAGKSFIIPSRIPLLQDHPRTCGEKCLLLSCAAFESGSPPHMRGKDFYRFHLSFDFRITPAHAGKSYSYQSTNH